MSKKIKYSIYSLRCPKTQEIKYVGSTTKTLYERLCGHIFTPNNKEKKRWIDDLKREDLKPIIEELECVFDKEKSSESERYWTQQMKFLGFNLYNKFMPIKNRNHSLYPLRVNVSQKTIKQIRLVQASMKLSGKKCTIEKTVNHILENLKT